jgi:hypothetical protein
MSIFAAGPHSPVVVRAAEAEYLPDIGHYLLADSSATHGALSTHRVQPTVTINWFDHQADSPQLRAEKRRVEAFLRSGSVNRDHEPCANERSHHR